MGDGMSDSTARREDKKRQRDEREKKQAAEAEAEQREREREVFEYIEGRCERLKGFGFHIEYGKADPGEFTLTLGPLFGFKSRVAALKKAEEMARKLGFE